MSHQPTKDTNIYEGNSPYLFISYSHKDTAVMEKVKAFLDDHQVRYWYDDGLHSGDDWNMVIAKHLQNAAICLLLLSPNSAESTYVKNELNFAMGRRIPIHTLLLKSFELPADIEMMTGRIQMVEMKGDYGPAILKSLPAEVFSHTDVMEEKQVSTHPIFQVGEELYERQGTTTFAAKHKSLHYPCAVQLDLIKSSDKYEIQNLCIQAGNVNHPLFPKIYDVEFKQNQMWTYQEYAGEQFLDLYLKDHKLSEDLILSWVRSVVDGMEYLYKRGLGLRDFARGSLMVTRDGKIMISRLNNLYYGLIALQEETKSYYFEKEIQEIAIFIAQLCIGKNPSLPLQMIEEPGYSKNFLDVMNLVVQKCARENGKGQYASFEQLKRDLDSVKISLKDKMFLNGRKKKLEQYNSAKAARSEKFTSSDGKREKNVASVKLPEMPKTNLEEQFGFDSTVVLGTDSLENGFLSFEEEKKPEIRIRICSTDEVLTFSKTRIVIGRDKNLCDMVWTQPYISRRHMMMEKLEDGKYQIADMNTANGVYLLSGDKKERIPGGGFVEVEAGAYILIGEAKIQIL